MCQLARSLVPFVPLVMAGKTGPGSRVAAGPAARAIFAALLYCDGPRHVRRVEIALKVVHPGLAGRGPLERCGATCRDELLLRNCIIIRIEFVVLTGYPHVVDSGAVVSNAKGQLGAGVYRELGGFEEVVGQDACHACGGTIGPSLGTQISFHCAACRSRPRWHRSSYSAA